MPPGATAALMSSPYQAQLAELRMQRLRMEEAQLLQVKREEELERMRGPIIRWCVFIQLLGKITKYFSLGTN